MSISAIDAILGPDQPQAPTDSTPDDAEALDAYSRAVTGVAERLSPSVGNLRVSRRVRGGRLLDGGGSSVVITPDDCESSRASRGGNGRGPPAIPT